MNKKIIVFICILSLLVPFLPQFDYEVKAYVDTTSQNSFIQNLVDMYQTYFGSNGVVVNSDWYNSTYPQGLLNDVCDNLGLEPIENDFSSAIYDYSITNNQSAEMIFNDTSQYVENKVNDMLPYYIYDFIDVNRFFNYYNFSNYPSTLQSMKNAFIGTLNDPDSVYFVSQINPRYSNFLGSCQVLSVSRNFFDDNFLCLKEGQFSVFPSYDYQTIRIPNDLASSSLLPSGYLSGLLQFYNPDSGFLGFSVDGFKYYRANYDYVTMHFDNIIGYIDSFNIYCGCVNDATGNYANESTIGTSFLCCGDSFSVPVFRSSYFLFEFLNGGSFVYKFNSNVSIPDGVDIDYSRLYDLISDSVVANNGNVIDSINNVADKYLQQQLDLLHDINNALNDGTGQSWLRRIYGLLDYNFPLTLQAFQDLQQAIQNISISGGGSDLSHINRVLDEINDKLGFMIEEPLSDADVQDMEDLKNLAQQKFPFCVFSDIVAISVILNQTPEQPHWQIPLKLPGSSSANNIEVDLSWYENVRDLVQGVFIFIFIVGLLALSVKIFSALKS